MAQAVRYLVDSKIFGLLYIGLIDGMRMNFRLDIFLGVCTLVRQPPIRG